MCTCANNLQAQSKETCVVSHVVDVCLPSTFVQGLPEREGRLLIGRDGKL